MRACLDQQADEGDRAESVSAQRDDEIRAQAGFPAIDALIGDDDRGAARQRLVDAR
jgi:hypothetical protein